MPDIVAWIPAVVGAIAAIAAITAAIINRGGTRRARREPTWGELLARVADLEQKLDEVKLEQEKASKAEARRMGAVLRLFRQIARQWPGDSSGPDLDPDDIALIEDTIPPQWIRPRARHRSTGTRPIDTVG